MDFLSFDERITYPDENSDESAEGLFDGRVTINGYSGDGAEVSMGYINFTIFDPEKAKIVAWQVFDDHSADLSMVYGHVEHAINEGARILYISSIETVAAFRNRGIMKRALRQFVNRYKDGDDYLIVTIPQADEGTSQECLEYILGQSGLETTDVSLMIYEPDWISG